MLDDVAVLMQPGEPPEPLSELWSIVQPWRRDAACREHPEIDFFPTRGASTAEARAVCAHCTVRGECLAYAQKHAIQHGVWGGLTVRQRQKMRREAA